VVNIDQNSRRQTGRFGPITGITVTEVAGGHAVCRDKLAYLQKVERLMPETHSSPQAPLNASDRPHCSKCGAGMSLILVARGPSGFDIRTFDCANCDHVHIVTVTTKL
jgi:hypothetical protein